MKNENKHQELPKLPHGDGVLVYTANGKILYRKSIPVDDGYKRLSVTGYTLKECFGAMQRKEAEIRAGLKSADNQPLTVAIDEWLRLYKQPEVILPKSRTVKIRVILSRTGSAIEISLSFWMCERFSTTWLLTASNSTRLKARLN